MSIIPLELALLRRAHASGDPRGVVVAAEQLVCTPWREEAVETFYEIFWQALEGDRRLARRAGRLDLRIAREERP